MIIARRAGSIRYSTDSIAQSVRDFTTASTRLEMQPAAERSAASGLDLARMYPGIFGTQRQPSVATGSVRATFGGLSAAALAVAAFVIGRHH